MNDVLTLIKRTPGKDENNKPIITETTRVVFCGVRSIGMAEFYQAHSQDFHPEAKFVLADYLDYNGETMCQHDGQRYNILRTYRTGYELELVAERAPVEDGGVYG